jgi:hypothetical protein
MSVFPVADVNEYGGRETIPQENELIVRRDI